ncbi:hypothetical protein NBRC116495_28120 [Aurantivibrio plasticivorans]
MGVTQIVAKTRMIQRLICACTNLNKLTSTGDYTVTIGSGDDPQNQQDRHEESHKQQGLDTRTGGWITQEISEVYENPWIKLEHHEVITPKNTPGIYGLVCFKHHAVGVIPIDSEGNTWLVKQSRYALNQTTWEIPEGGAELNEDPLEAAQRELLEETGLVANRWKKLMSIHPSNSVTDQAGTIFIATELTAGKQALEDTEDIELRQLPLSSAIKMALDGEITDAMSVAALLKVAVLNQIDIA